MKKKPTNKKSINQAAKACRDAFKKHPDSALAWCCHHEILCEQLTEPPENRIKFILKNKPETERVIRLNNFRPVRDEMKLTSFDADYRAKRASLDADYRAKRASLYADYKAKSVALQESLIHLYKQDVLFGTWNGKSIFESD